MTLPYEVVNEAREKIIGVLDMWVWLLQHVTFNSESHGFNVAPKWSYFKDQGTYASQWEDSWLWVKRNREGGETGVDATELLRQLRENQRYQEMRRKDV